MKQALLWAALTVLPLFLRPALALPDPAAAVRDAIRTEGVQTELPLENIETDSHWLTFPSWLIDILLWGGVIAGAATIAFAMRDSLPLLDKSRRLAVAGESGAGRPTVDLMFAARSQADELAAHGRYAEAMHILLLRALVEMRERLHVSFADSLTSREILRRAPLEDVARQAFARIIGKVELTHFGDAIADHEDYSACRGQFEALRRALGAEGAR